MKPTKGDGGSWVYPAGWDDAAKATWEALQRALVEAQRAPDEAPAEASPADAIAELRAELDDVRKARERANREAEGAAAWKKAQAEHGDRVAKIECDTGDTVVILAPNKAEIDAANKRYANLLTAGMKGGKSQADAHAEANGAHEDATMRKILHPPRERAKALVDRYPLLLARIYDERDALIRGWRLDQGKGSAP